MRRFTAPILACVLLLSLNFAGYSRADAPSDTTAADQPDATLELTAGSVAAGIGYTWGSGHLIYKGQRHDFRLSGLSIVNVGVAHITASGVVYHLQKLSDLNGNYTAVAAGLAVAGGNSVAALRNENGVVIRLLSTTQGLQFNLSADGIKIHLDR